MEIIEVNYPLGVAQAKGVRREIGLQLLPEQNVSVGDYVIVHVGFAIEKIDRQQADEIWHYLDEIARIMDEEDEERARDISGPGHG